MGPWFQYAVNSVTSWDTLVKIARSKSGACTLYKIDSLTFIGCWSMGLINHI